MKKPSRAVPRFLLQLAHHYGLKANRVRAEKGPEHLHTRRLERIAKHLRAAHDGIVGNHEVSGPSRDSSSGLLYDKAPHAPSFSPGSRGVSPRGATVPE